MVIILHIELGCRLHENETWLSIRPDRLQNRTFENTIIASILNDKLRYNELDDFEAILLCCIQELETVASTVLMAEDHNTQAGSNYAEVLRKISQSIHHCRDISLTPY